LREEKQTVEQKPSQSPQARWARKQVKAGKCRICGEPRNKYKSLCDMHQALFTRYMRNWRKAKKNAQTPTEPFPTNTIQMNSAEMSTLEQT